MLASQLITNALRLYGIIDQTENALPPDIANNVIVLNDLLRSEMSDGACQFLIRRVSATLPPGVNGQAYTFSIGTANAGYLVQQDAVAMRFMWMNDVSLTVNRETRMASSRDVLRTSFPGIITKWHQERQTDGSILVTAWQPPRASCTAIIEYGQRVPPITAADGSDAVGLPPEGLHDATLLLGLTVCGSYGRPSSTLDPVLLSRAKAVNDRWRDWARGQQWLQLLRS